MVILTEKANPKTVDIDLKSSYDVVKLINEQDQLVALAVEKELPQIGDAVEKIAQALLKGGRLAYFGAGTSGRIGVLDASECWPTFGVSKEIVKGYIAGGDRALRDSIENAEDSVQLGLDDISDFNPGENDVVVGISASGAPRYVLAVLEYAQKAGALTIGLSSNPDAALKQFSDIFICPVVGQEAITGSSRMKSGTAQKMVLNMLSTGAMIRIGKVYKNYMIDLKMTNEKLVDRARRFVSEICSISIDEASKRLDESGNSVKTACVMELLQCDRKTAEQKLLAAGGILRKVIR